MTKIFIEAEGKTTPEYNFLKAFVDMHFSTKDVDFNMYWRNRQPF